MDIYFNDTQFVRIIFDPFFYRKYGCKQYAFYECIGDDEDEHYADIYLPTDLSKEDLISTVSYEAGRAALDRQQTAIVTIQGQIVKRFLEQM